MPLCRSCLTTSIHGVFFVCSLVLRDPPAVQIDAELKGNVAKAFFEAVEADKKKVSLHPLHRSRCLCYAGFEQIVSGM